MDDLERLQTMFPSLDGDVVAIVFNEYKNDGKLVGKVFELVVPVATPPLNFVWAGYCGVLGGRKMVVTSQTLLEASLGLQEDGRY